MGPTPPGTGVIACARVDAESKSTDRKSTRLNSSHGYISYAVFCLKKKKIMTVAAVTINSLTQHVPHPLDTGSNTPQASPLPSDLTVRISPIRHCGLRNISSAIFCL